MASRVEVTLDCVKYESQCNNVKMRVRSLKKIENWVNLLLVTARCYVTSDSIFSECVSCGVDARALTNAQH